MHAFEVITVDPTGSEYDALLECSTTVFRGLPSRLGLYVIQPTISYNLVYRDSRVSVLTRSVRHDVRRVPAYTQRRVHIRG